MTRSSVRTDSRQVANPRRVRLGRTPEQKPVHGGETAQEQPWDVVAAEVVEDQGEREVVHHE
jgi:hypothetical protein